jgi:hypothetical protein
LNAARNLILTTTPRIVGCVSPAMRGKSVIECGFHADDDALPRNFPCIAFDTHLRTSHMPRKWQSNLG